MQGERPVQALLFDMDNTLFDLVGAKRAACRVIIGKIGVGSPDHLFSYFLRRIRGFEDPENIRDFLHDEGVFSEETFAWCSAAYREQKLSHIEPYPGVQETLQKLAEEEYPMVLVTDAHHRDALPRLEKTGLCNLFDHIVTYDMTREKKPSPIPFLYALQRVNTGPGEAMIIGDSPRRDIAPGRELGMITVYARYGDRFSSAREDGGAHFLIDEFRELLPLLEGLREHVRGGRSPCAAGSLSP
ncbi:MAG: HAD family hydrolase [Methanolinea sp.]|jgi:putative hydrolase of the HAD superfamily|nr:HAD family hydrolase [Methanolinea sp.]